MFDNSAQLEMDTDTAATNLQRMMKGYVSRKIANRERLNEFMFVGMDQRNDNVDTLESELDIAHRKRKQEQIDNKDAYERALEELKDVILEEEGPEKREQLREERTLWVTDQIAQDKFPEDLEKFYKSKKPIAGEGDDDDGGKKGGKGDKKDKGKGDKKDKKDKKEKGIHSLTYSLTHSHNHSLTHSLNHSLTH
jgi:hypothetical protein